MRRSQESGEDSAGPDGERSGASLPDEPTRIRVRDCRFQGCSFWPGHLEEKQHVAGGAGPGEGGRSCAMWGGD